MDFTVGDRELSNLGAVRLTRGIEQHPGTQRHRQRRGRQLQRRAKAGLRAVSRREAREPSMEVSEPSGKEGRDGREEARNEGERGNRGIRQLGRPCSAVHNGLVPCCGLDPLREGCADSSASDVFVICNLTGGVGICCVFCHRTPFWSFPHELRGAKRQAMKLEMRP